MPSDRAKNESSSPSRNSSSTSVVSRAPVSVPSKRPPAARKASAVVRQMMTPLPAARPSALTTTGREKRGSSSATSSRSVQAACAAVGMSCRRIKSLGEGLRGFKHRGGLCGAENAQTVGLEAIGEAEGKRDFRADDDQGGALGQGERNDGVRIRDRNGDAAAEVGDAGVAGKAEEVDVGGAAKGPGKGVLAAAAADQEDLHGMRVWLLGEGRRT